jgi:hypothetical protein
MSREYSTIIGSGQVPHVASSPPYSIPDGTYPVPSQRDSLRARTGQGAVILNPEDFSVSIGLRTFVQSVTAAAEPVPASPLENRRALVIHNDGPSTVYLGASDVTTSTGLPLATDEKIAFDIQGTPNVQIYVVAVASDSTIRVLELA